MPIRKPAMPAKKHVLIAEDHQMLREGLKAILADREELDVVGEAVDGLEALRKVKRLKPDLMLLDLSMPRMNGLSVLLDAKNYQSDIKILVLTIHQSEAYVLETFEAGADGYCSKNDSREELLVAIDSVLSGKTYLSPLIARHVLDGFLSKRAKQESQTAWENVTQREKEILKLLAEGYTNSEIADMLCISVKTVEKHRSNIMAKLDLHNVAQLTTLAIEKGLVESKS
jgi:DNA-binding NarL/FixJ family response regulator